MAFTTLVMSNIWLTLVSRSNQESVLSILRRPNSLLWLMLAITASMVVVALGFPPVRDFAQFTRLASSDLGQCLVWSLAGVGWIEGYKWWKRSH